ncbi:hypothetical protein D8674_034842 [Pyrus ussuriensis x Pyrus communis]|uniref:Uncharacterized protein n=1 Tax=Pyrus ussuriensis x Pyrus communis TaxID=2448454 RepID=A0A5N5GAU5_9ROSA|nr:hypothetical protein D8674_034842 [Pyrus ussuriensis x Pyrus communis]
MAAAMVKIPVILRSSDDMFEFPGTGVSLGDMVLDFIEEVEVSPEFNTTSGSDEDDENSCSVEENKAFWEEQDQLLRATLCKSSSVESKIRQATKEALREINSSSEEYCVCARPVAGGCRKCLRTEVCKRLIESGYNCVICKSKWRSSTNAPAGEHTYLEVLDNSSKRGEIRVAIELNFGPEFEMARASENYNRLISWLPEVFVGKAERLRALIKILCGAAKKCMKEKKMHLGPWRKHKYMQAKWFGTLERSTPGSLPVGFSHGPPKPKASILAFDLLEVAMTAGLHCSSTAVEVL